MKDTARSSQVVRFGAFKADLGTGELLKNGRRIRLQEQPFQILTILLEHPGEVVTREELHQKLWHADNTFVDFDHGLNNAINRLREALGDSADSPRFIETLSRRGYRFIASVEAPPPPAEVSLPLAVQETTALQPTFAAGQPTQSLLAKGVSEPAREHVARRHLRPLWVSAVGGAVLLAALVGLGIGGWRDRLVRRAGPLHIRSIAVLPLENLTGDPAQDYFADGMTDALITNLARIRSLHVISRTSAIQYKATKKPLPQIGRELDVDAVVEGTVVRSGDRVRIDAQLIHAATDRHLWANSYQRDLRDILALQSDVARAIAAEVQTELTPQEQLRLASTRTIEPEAYEAYLKGRYSSSKGTAEGINKGIEYFEQAIQKDPNYASAYAGLADAYNLLGFGVVAKLPPKEAARRARTASMKALELDDTLGEAHAALGFTKFLYDWEWGGAENEYRRAIELNPSSAIGYHRYSLLLGMMGRADEALRNIKRAQQLDPLSPAIHRVLVDCLIGAGKGDQALEQSRTMLDLHSQSFDAHFGAGIAYAQRAMYQEAIAELEKASDLSGGNASARSWLAHSYVATGRGAEAEKIVNELRAQPNRATFAFQIATIYADLGRKNDAFEWLEKCYEARCATMVHLKHSPKLVQLRSDPRYQDLLRRTGFPE